MDFFWIVVKYQQKRRLHQINNNFLKAKEHYYFRVFRLDVAERRLWYGGDEQIPLTPKQFDLLLFFVENAGRVMKKDELLEAVWADAYVEETTLARNVSWLRKKLAECGDGKEIIETVPKLGYRFTADVTRFDADKNALVIEEETFQYFRGEETFTLGDAFAGEKEDGASERKENRENMSFSPPNPPRHSASLLSFFLIASGLVALIVFAASTRRTATGSSQIKIGSVVNLENRSADGGGYLDAWGLVRNKPEFVRQVPTETMFVSTHKNPNRNNGSGSWEIVSATGKNNNDALLYGDKIHLRNRHPDSDYLDNCGWLVDMPVFKDFAEIEKFAVFTTYAKDRDNGTGIWIVTSNVKPDGSEVLEGDGISLENAFPGGGYLNTAGRTSDLPAFDDYDGSLLVFIRESAASRPDSGIWTITTSKATLK